MAQQGYLKNKGWGLAVRAVREKEELTRPAFAKRIGCSVQSVSNIETGVRGLSSNFYEALCKAFPVIKSIPDPPISSNRGSVLGRVQKRGSSLKVKKNPKLKVSRSRVAKVAPKPGKELQVPMSLMIIILKIMRDRNTRSLVRAFLDAADAAKLPISELRRLYADAA